MAVTTVAVAGSTRGLAWLPDGSGQALVQIKAVDGVYPHYGAVAFENGRTLADIRRPNAVAVERGLLEQLGIGEGARIVTEGAELLSQIR